MTLVFACAVSAVQHAAAAQTPVAFVVGTGQVAALAACIAERTAASGPVSSADRMVEGLEFRVSMRSASQPSLVTITALLKPDVISLIQHQDHDEEAQPETVWRLYRQMRVHVGTRAWIWVRRNEADICNEAAAWVQDLRAHPIVFDRLGPDGEPQRRPPP